MMDKFFNQVKAQLQSMSEQAKDAWILRQAKLTQEDRQADFLIQGGFCDFVAIGRGILADPGWARKALEGRDDAIEPCRGCVNCQWRIDPSRCPAAISRANRA